MIRRAGRRHRIPPRGPDLTSGLTPHTREALGSKPFGDGRHANFDAGTLDSELIAAVFRDAGCDVIIETPPTAT